MCEYINANIQELHYQVLGPLPPYEQNFSKQLQVLYDEEIKILSFTFGILPPEWIEKFKGKFDMGWNAMREQIFANQKRLGVIPENAKLTPWPDSLPKWETLSADEK